VSLDIQIRHVEAAYSFLCALDPFAGLPMPEADAVEFVVSAHRDRAGDHRHTGVDHRITVSSYWIGSLDQLLQTVAHEMIHLIQHERKQRRTHGAEFQRLALIICDQCGWDHKAFS
jgi:hypothetical protein